MFYGGIDNGNKGALVLLDERYRVIQVDEMPLINVGKGKKNKWVVDKVRVLHILDEWREHADVFDLFVVLEKAQAMPKQGVSSTFKIGRDYGLMEMALLARGIHHEIVHPRTWQSAVLKGIEGKDTKARAILKCQRALPGLDLTPGRKRVPQDGIADGGCMAMHGMTLRPPLPPQRKQPPPPPRNPTKYR